MYNKLHANYNKRCVYNYEDGPPEKKLISDGDLFIKQLTEKQLNTKVNLQEYENCKSRFYKSTEEMFVTKYISGSQSLEKFNSVIKHLNDVEKLKSSGLTNQEVELLFDYQVGEEYVKSKHKNMNGEVLNTHIKDILDKMTQSSFNTVQKTSIIDRLNKELLLSAKPSSTETKLLKFALENNESLKVRLPGPMDNIKDVEIQLVAESNPINVKKIRRKARSLNKQIKLLDKAVVSGPKHHTEHTEACTSKWDAKECMPNTLSRKIYTCKPQNYYTIKNDTIVEINTVSDQVNLKQGEQKKISLKEIMTIPKFRNYEKGAPSKLLYLKNIAKGVGKDDLWKLFFEFTESIVSIDVMKGRMQGQAFVEFRDEPIAGRAIDQCNGTVFKNKPVIIQFAQRKVR